MAHTRSDEARTWGTGWWQAILLGLVLILAGLYILMNAAGATVVSAIVFGIALLVAGLFEIVQAFWAQHWAGLLWRLLLGAFYAIAGAVLVADPVAASVLVTLVFAAALIASGIVRIVMALQDWHRLGWLLLASGIVGVLAGLIILAKWPFDGLWVFGLVVGIDLVLHGAWWVAIGWTGQSEPRAA